MDRVRNFNFMLKDVSQLWRRHFEALAGQIGLTLTQARVLMYLSLHEGIRQGDLAELCDTAPMTLVRVLDRMQREGLLERRADPNDRRAYRLFLRPAADVVLVEIEHIGDQARTDALAGLSNQERIQLHSMLKTIKKNLGRKLRARCS